MDFKKYNRLDSSKLTNMVVSVVAGPVNDNHYTDISIPDRHRICFESGFKMVNRTDTTLFVQDRAGPVTAIPCSAINAENHRRAGITKTHTLDFPASPSIRVNKGFVDVMWYYTAAYTEMGKLAEHYHNFASQSSVWAKLSRDIPKFLNDKFIRNSKICTVVVTATIQSEDIAGNAPIFIPEFGITLADLQNRDKITNPFNLEELVRYYSGYVENGVGVEGDPAFFRMVAYVNRKGLYDRLFVRVMETVQEVPVLYDDTGERHGIEVYEKRPVNRQGRLAKSGLRHFTFEEAFDHFELSTTIEGAYRVKEERVKDLKLQSELEEVSLKLQTIELQKSKLEHDHNEARIKFERELEKMARDKELLQLKYDQETLARNEMAMQKNIQSRMDFVKGSLGLFGQIVNVCMQIVKALPKPVG